MSTYEVPNLVYGMHHLNITQLPGGDFSHPNMAMDLAGQDAGVDFWFAKCCDWKCIAGEWGSGTYFFIPCDSKGNHINIMCADGKQRKVTVALTHSKKQYVKTERGKIYSKNQPMYEEGTKGKATGNHIHLEIAEGYKTTKYYDSKLGVYTMGNELNPVKMFYVLDGYTKVVNTKGATLPHTKSEYTKVVTVDKYAPTLPFTQPDTNKIVNAHRYDFTYKNFATFIKNKGGYSAYVNSLGGVFTKWHNKNVTAKPTYKVTTVKEFKECADYVWGLMTMYGFNYTDVNGKKVWGSSSGTYGNDAFYDKSVNLKQFFDGSTNKNGFKVGIDQICSGSTKGGMMVNCSWAVTYLFHKAGLIPEDGENMEVEFYGDKDYHKYYRKKGAKILTPKNSADFKVGDVIGFYGSGTGFTYKHCCVVVDVNKTKGTYTIYDGGSARFTKTRGNNIVGKLGDSPLYGSYKSFKVLRLPLNLKEETTTPTTTVTKPNILFIGNSYTYKPNDKENLPQQFKAICKANGVDVDVTMIAEGGWTFEKHWNNSATTTALKSKKYKYVIMQGQSEEVGCMNGEMKISAKTYSKKLADLAKQYGAKVYFMSQADYYFRKWSDGSKTYYNMKYQNNVDANYKTLGYPVAYGGKEVKRQANGSYASYFASDGYHPTAKAQKIVAQVIWDSLRQYLKPIKYVNATGVASYYDKNKGGTYKVVAKDGLNIRNDGDQSAKSLGVLPYNTEFKTYGYYDKDSQGREWLYGLARVGNTEYTGFCCSKSYLKKV